MPNKYIIKVLKAVYVIETYTTLNDSEKDALQCVENGEAELEEYEILQECDIGEVIADPEIIDVKFDKGDY